MGDETNFFEELKVGMYSVSPTRSVQADEIKNWLDFTGDWQNQWRAIFRPTLAGDPGPGAANLITPSLLLLGHSFGFGYAGIPLWGIVATYRVESIAHTALLRAGEPYHVRSEIISLEPVGEEFGNVRTVRHAVREDGTICLSMVEKARFRTRAAWEKGSG